ncbi:hypothetical protein IWZ00DRAFT_220995 [Phyllosticta capitalensis]
MEGFDSFFLAHPRSVGSARVFSASEGAWLLHRRATQTPGATSTTPTKKQTCRYFGVMSGHPTSIVDNRVYRSSLAGAARLIICSLLLVGVEESSHVSHALDQPIEPLSHLSNPSRRPSSDGLLSHPPRQGPCSQLPTYLGVSCKHEKNENRREKCWTPQKPMKQPGEPNSHLLRVDVPNHCRRASPTPTLLSTPINVAGPLLLNHLVSSPPAKRN